MSVELLLRWWTRNTHLRTDRMPQFVWQGSRLERRPGRHFQLFAETTISSLPCAPVALRHTAAANIEKHGALALFPEFDQPVVARQAAELEPRVQSHTCYVSDILTLQEEEV